VHTFLHTLSRSFSLSWSCTLNTAGLAIWSIGLWTFTEHDKQTHMQACDWLWRLQIYREQGLVKAHISSLPDLPIVPHAGVLFTISIDFYTSGS
jgi:hypothetical protein